MREERSTHLPAGIRNCLDDLRAALRRWQWVVGLSKLLMLLVLLCAGSLLLDSLWKMDQAQRSLLLVLATLGTLTASWFWLFRPLRRPLRDEFLCSLYEKHYGQLQDQLLSAFSFAQTDRAATGLSSPLMDAAVQEAESLVASLSVKPLINWKLLKRILTAALLLSAAGLLFTALRPETARIWVQRNLLLQNVSWPQKTRLVVLGLEQGVLVVPEGDSLELQVRAEGKFPLLVELTRRENRNSEELETHSMKRLGEDRFVWSSPKVFEAFELRVSGGDDRGTWIPVEIRTRPQLLSLELQVIEPAYTGRAPVTLPPGQRQYRILEGSQIQLRGEVDKSLRSGTLLRDGEAVAGLELDGAEFQARLSAQMLASGQWELQYEDASGLAPKRFPRFSLLLQEDQEPVVRSELRGVGRMITPEARLPIWTQVQDDYAVTRLEVLVENQKAVELEAGPGSAPSYQAFPVGEALPFLGQPEWELEHLLDLRDLPRKAGDTVTLFLDAGDNAHTITEAGQEQSASQAGQSSAFVLRVVTAEELLNELSRQEQQLQGRLSKAVDDQASLLADTQTLMVSFRKRGQADSKRLGTLQQLERRQGSLSQDIRSITEALRLILEEVRNNRIEDRSGAMHTRLGRGVIDPLASLSASSFPESVLALKEARISAVAQQEVEPKLRQSAQRQSEQLEQMRVLLARMQRWEEYSAILQRLRNIVDEEKKLYDATLQEEQQAVEDLFDD